MKMQVYSAGTLSDTVDVDCIPHACDLFEQCALHSRVRAIVRGRDDVVVAVLYLDATFGVCVREPQDPSYRHWDL